MSAREKSAAHFKAANTAVTKMSRALWEAFYLRQDAEHQLDEEAAMMRAEYEKRGEAYVPSSADHTRARLTEAEKPIEQALRALLGDETFELGREV